MPGTRAGRAGGGVGAGGWPGTAADEGGDTAVQRLVHLLRADEMDVRVDTTGGDDLALGRDHLGAGAHWHVHARLHIGVASLADHRDTPVLDTDIGLDDAPVVDDQGIGQYQVHGFGSQHLALPHAIADDLAATELHLFAIDGEVVLHLDPQRGVGQAHAVAHGGAEHVGIGLAGNAAHALPSSAPITLPWKP